MLWSGKSMVCLTITSTVSKLLALTSMSSLDAAMRKLVHLCFGVFKTQQPYQRDYLKNA